MIERSPTNAYFHPWIFYVPEQEKEELLIGDGTLKKMFVLRRILNPMGTVDAMEFLLDKISQTKDNNEFYDSMNT